MMEFIGGVVVGLLIGFGWPEGRKLFVKKFETLADKHRTPPKTMGRGGK